MERGSGILLHISSLKSAYGIGSIGQEAKNAVDFIKECGCKYWQVLPLSPTGYGDSPYQACSIVALNPYFIDLDTLKDEGLLTLEELEKEKVEDVRVDYARLFKTRFVLLRKAFARFNKNDKEFVAFSSDKDSGFFDYALYMAIKEHSGFKSMEEWDKGLKFRNYDAINNFILTNKEDVAFWQFTQFKFLEQWTKLKEYANKKGVKIIGDMAIYTALDSVEVWKYPEMFRLKNNLAPKEVAGVPPDYFSADGQLWGNPIYDWKYMSRDNFEWWKSRINYALKIYDVVRIDHFRGFDRYFTIKYGMKNAKIGKWKKAPGFDLFKNFVGSNIIAEDLGTLDDGVKKLIKKTGFPGMRVMIFGLEDNETNPYLPSNVTKNCILYTGTHDNQTLSQFIEEVGIPPLKKIIDREAKKMGVEWNTQAKTNADSGDTAIKTTADSGDSSIKTTAEQIGARKIAEEIIELGFASKADTFVVPYQDLIFSGEETRMNVPATLSEKNWSYRLTSPFDKDVSTRLKEWGKKYNR